VGSVVPIVCSAFHRTSVEGLKDPPGDSELPQLPEVVEALLRLPQQSINVCCSSQILCNVDSQVPEAADRLHGNIAVVQSSFSPGSTCNVVTKVWHDFL